tara:strand:+ start:259 stop:1812 length:1554 start_codon:yes stop_codon:yes gene_type:complete
MVALSELENIVKQSDPNNKAQKHLNEYESDENTFFQALTNIPSSAQQFGSDIITPFLHPIKTAKSIGQLGSSVVNLFRSGDQGNEELAKQVGNFFVQRYGSLENIKKTFATDPVGMLSDVSIILTGGGALAAKAPAMAGTVGNVVKTAGKVVDPINVATKAVSAASPIVSAPLTAALGMTTGAGGEALRQGFQAGKVGGDTAEAFTSSMRGKTDMAEVVTDGTQAMKTISDQSKKTYKGGIDKLKLDKVELKFGDMKTSINNLIESKKFGGEFTISQKAQNKLKSLQSIINKWEKNPNLHNAKGFDMLKRRIDAEYPQGLKVGDEGIIVTEVRKVVFDEIVKKVPAYKKVMKAYEEAVTLEKQMLKELSLGNKSGAGTILRKLQSVMRDNANTNWGKRYDYVKMLDEANLDANIITKLAGQSLSSFVPRGLAQGGANLQLAGVGYGALSGAFNPAALIPSLVASSPRAMGELSYGAGRFSNVANKVLPKVSAVSRPARPAGLLEQQNESLIKRGLLQ